MVKLKGKGNLLILGVALVVGVLILGQLNVLPFFAITGDEVWCSEWISIGCGISENANQTAYIATAPSYGYDVGYFTCAYDKGCEIESVASIDFSQCLGGMYLKKGNTYLAGPVGIGGLIGFQDIIKSDLPGQFLANGESIEIKCNDLFLGPAFADMSITFTGKRLRLAYCSSGPTATSCDAGVSGVEILGADGCHYNVGDRPGATDPAVLDVQGNTIGSSAQSFLVPEGSNIWVPNPTKLYVCGTTTDMCQLNSDCYYQHPFSWPLDARLGNADIVGGKVVVYGCAATGPQACSTWSGTVAGKGECLQTVQTNYCTITQDNVMVAECNPMTSTCGSNAFCNPLTLKCEAVGEVQCSSDAICGTTIACDRVSKTLKKPYCKNPGTTTSYCDFETLQNIECCTTIDCGAGYYCQSDYTCAVQQDTIQECPFVCCEGDPTETGYWPNVPAGKHCCPDHTQVVDDLSQCGQFECQDDQDCYQNEVCEDGECVDAAVCVERAPQPPFIVGWQVVITDTPIYLIPLPFGGGLIEIGRTTTEECLPINDYSLLYLAIIGIVGTLAVVIVWKKVK